MIEFTFHFAVKPVGSESQKLEYAHMLSLDRFFCSFYETIRSIRFIHCTDTFVVEKRQTLEYSEPHSGITSEQLS